jgi:tetratricopeptide (TPR) repeat protein
MTKKVKYFFLIVGLLMCTSLSVFILPQADKMITLAYIRMGELLFYLRGHDQAESLFLRAVDKLKGEHSSILVKDLRRLAWQRSYIDANLHQGEILIKKAILVSENNSEELASLYKDLGEILNQEEKYPEAEDVLLESIRIYRSLNNTGQQFDIALKMAIYYSQLAMWREAEKELTLAILFRDHNEIKSTLSNEQSTELCLLLGKMILHVVKDKNKALEYHLAAYDHAQKASLQKQVQVQIAFGSYYETNFQFADAMEKYRFAAALCPEDGLELEHEHLKQAMQGCLRKFSMEISENSQTH